MKLRYIIHVVILLYAINLDAQRNIIYDHYYLNNIVYNPAEAGRSEIGTANLSVAKQWAGIANSPTTQVFSIQERLEGVKLFNPKSFVPKKEKGKVALGAVLFNDQNGPESFRGIHLAYAYHLTLWNETKFSLALSTTLSQFTLNQNEFMPIERADPEISWEQESWFVPDFNFGFLMYHPRYYIGVSVCELLASNLQPNAETNNNKRDYFLSGGYSFEIGTYWKIEADFLILSMGGDTKTALDIIPKLTYNEKLWLALGYSTNELAIVYLGFRIGKLSFGYNFNYSYTPLMTYTAGNHLVFAGYNFK